MADNEIWSSTDVPNVKPIERPRFRRYVPPNTNYAVNNQYDSNAAPSDLLAFTGMTRDEIIAKSKDWSASSQAGLMHMLNNPGSLNMSGISSEEAGRVGGEDGGLYGTFEGKYGKYGTNTGLMTLNNAMKADGTMDYAENQNTLFHESNHFGHWLATGKGKRDDYRANTELTTRQASAIADPNIRGPQTVDGIATPMNNMFNQNSAYAPLTGAVNGQRGERNVDEATEAKFRAAQKYGRRRDAVNQMNTYQDGNMSFAELRAQMAGTVPVKVDHIREHTRGESFQKSLQQQINIGDRLQSHAQKPEAPALLPFNTPAVPVRNITGNR
jgi:hypothetical protein